MNADAPSAESNEPDPQAQVVVADWRPCSGRDAVARLGDFDSDQVAGVVADRSVLLPDRADLRAHGRLHRPAAADRASSVDRRRATGAGRDHRVRARAPERRRLELFLVALHAADHRGEHHSVAAERRDGRRPQLGDVRRARGCAVHRHAGPAVHDRGRVPAGSAGRDVHRRHEHLRVHGRRGAERIPRGTAPAHGRGAGARVESARRPPGLQRARHQQPDERPGDDRHGRARADASTSRPRRSPACRRHGPFTATRARCCSCRRRSIRCSGPASSATRIRGCRAWNTCSRAPTAGGSRWASAPPS